MDTSSIKNENRKEEYFRAKEKVNDLKSFYFSLIFFTVVNLGLIYIWYEYSSHSFQWFWFPLIGWGIGLTLKGLKLYNVDIILGKQWETRQINRFMGNQDTGHHSDNYGDHSYERAKKKVESIKGFYSHLIVYLLVNAFIVTTIVSATGIEVFSFTALATPLFWGIGLVSHAFGVFGEDLFFSKSWEDRKIKAFMDAQQRELK